MSLRLAAGFFREIAPVSKPQKRTSRRTQPLTALEFVEALCIMKVFHRFRVGL